MMKKTFSLLNAESCLFPQFSALENCERSDSWLIAEASSQLHLGLSDFGHFLSLSFNEAKTASAIFPQSTGAISFTGDCSL
jgi:hypothetical protein